MLAYLIAGTSSATQVIAHDWSDMPLWAYGVTTVPHVGDRAKPPDPPQRKFDPAIDHVEQLRPPHVEGSERTFSRVDLSDWQNVVDWFPNEHVPMPSVVQHGPASLGAMTRAGAFCMRAVLMKPVVARLTPAQMTDIAAYVATLLRAEVARH